MGLFGNNIRKIVKEFRKISEYYSDDLSRDINESFEDLKADYEEISSVIPEFCAFVSELKPKLSDSDTKKLESFASRLNKVNRSAKNGVEAMHELSRSQKKLTSENLQELEALQF